MNKHGSYFLKMYQHRSYVIALSHAANVQGMYIDAVQDGLSFRNHGDLLLVGGGGHRTGKRGGNWRELRDFARRFFPKASEVAAWATQDCITLDGMPYLGRYSARTPNLYVATGFNKWGMSSSMVAADILGDEIAGKENPYAAVFSPSRFDPGLKAKKFFIETADMLANYIGGYVQVPPDQVRDLPAGEGRILLIDGERVGVYKESDGTLYTIKPYCTHMGCVLDWNADESSWDCPCHGSRYDYTGRIINGPAIEPLESSTEEHSAV